MFPSLFTLWCLSSLYISSIHASEEPNQVTLQKWQYCAGCKATVEIFANIAHKEIIHMQKEGKPIGEELNATPLSDRLCESPMYDTYEPFIRYACIKLMDDHRMDVLNGFAGDASVAFNLMKANIYEKTKNICMKETRACPSYMFPDTALPKKDRTLCEACRIMVDDMEIMKSVIRKGRQTNEEVVEKICPTLGYNHQPYNWLETNCDMIVDEYMDDIVEMLNMRDRLLATGMTPKQTLSEKICGDLLSCGTENEKYEL